MEWWQIQELLWTVTGIIAVLAVVGGVTLRLVVKPFLADLTKLRKDRQVASNSQADQRLDRIEDQLESLSSSVERLAEVSDFDRQLKAGDPEQG